MAHHVYILYSPSANRYYIGNTDLDPQIRLEQHNDRLHQNAWTKVGIPWEIFSVLSCRSRLQARRIEAHIKRMKSRKYLQNLERYPDMREKLLTRYEEEDGGD